MQSSALTAAADYENNENQTHSRNSAVSFFIMGELFSIQ